MFFSVLANVVIIALGVVIILMGVVALKLLRDVSHYDVPPIVFTFEYSKCSILAPNLSLNPSMQLPGV